MIYKTLHWKLTIERSRTLLKIVNSGAPEEFPVTYIAMAIGIMTENEIITNKTQLVVVNINKMHCQAESKTWLQAMWSWSYGMDV